MLSCSATSAAARDGESRVKRFVKQLIDPFVADGLGFRWRSDDDHNFAFWNVVGIAFGKLRQVAGHAFFVKLGQFADDRRIARTQLRQQREQRIAQTRPPFIEHRASPEPRRCRR